MAKVLGLGNALVDIMTKLESDDFLNEQGLPKGSMQLVELDVSGKVLNAAEELDKSQSSGGSAANTIHGISNLGAKCGYIGTVGKDAYGEFFRKDMEKNNIEPKLFLSDMETGRAIALISKDSERTFATYLGAALELFPGKLSNELYIGYDILHTEGYLVFNNDLIQRALELAKANGLKVSLDMASYNVVEANLNFLRGLIFDYVDIVFANEEEAKALTGKEPEEALHEIAEMCEIAVVKVGAKGSMIKSKGEVIKVDAIESKPVDTTGAGDLYASGFLYGLSNDMPLEKCGNMGSLLAGKVIEVVGAKMEDTTWNEINEKISKM